MSQRYVINLLRPSLNPECLEIEIAKHFKTWRKFAQGLLKDKVKGEDLLSEVLLKILENQREKANELACSKQLYYYVNRAIYLAANDSSSRYAVKYLNYGKRWQSESNKHEQEREMPWLGSRLDNEYLDAYISTMSKIDSVVMRIYIMQDFNYAEVSEKTGIPVKDLYKLVENAVNKIKRNVEFQRASGHL